MITTLKLFMAILFVLPLSTFAGQEGGGGNTVNHKLVENYAVLDTKTIPGFDGINKYLDMFEEKIPGCGNSLKRIAYPNPTDEKSVIWYLIPAKIAELPVSVTGFDFSTEQPAMQSGPEIFLSLPEIENELDIERDQLFLHEILMMDHPQKSGEAVRRLMIYLKRTNYNPKATELRNLMAKLGYWYCGSLSTKTEAEAQEKQKAVAQEVVQTSEKENLISFISSVSAVCQSSTSDAQKLKEMESAIKYPRENSTFFSLSDSDWAKIPPAKKIGLMVSDDEKGTQTVAYDLGKYMTDVFQDPHFARLTAIVLPCAPAGAACSDKLGMFLSSWTLPTDLRDQLGAIQSIYRDALDAKKVFDACSDINALRSTYDIR